MPKQTGYTRVGPGLPPVCGAQASALILGSFPSPKSREQGFFYGHPQNRFWPLLADLTGAPAPAWEDTRRRLAPAPRTAWRPRRVLVLGGAVAAIAVAATFIVDSGETPRQAPLGVLEAAAATAAMSRSAHLCRAGVMKARPRGPGRRSSRARPRR